MKKIMSILLTAALTIGLLPAVALADTDTEGGSGIIEEAVLSSEGDAALVGGGVGDDAIGTSYKIYLPDGYDEGQKYPAVYLMPYDGYSSAQYMADGIQGKLDEIFATEDAVDMIVVMPTFQQGADYTTELEALVANVESKYPVIPDSRYRAILGVNVGGYMAVETAVLTNSATFYSVGSHMGDFTSEANPYIESKGSIFDYLKGLNNRAGAQAANAHYFYIDAPNGDALSTAAGGTSDIGAALEKASNPYWPYGGSYYLYSTPNPDSVEYAILDGEGNADFYLNSLARSLNRFSKRFTESLFTGSLSVTPQAVTSSDNEMTATVSFTMTDSIARYLETVPEVEITVSMSDPADGTVLYTDSAVISGLAAGEEREQTFTLSRSNMASGINTTLSATASFLGMTQDLASLSMVSVQDTGEADDEQLVDLMGNWYFKAYKTYRPNDTTVEELDQIANITPDVYETWGVVQPALGWWTGDFDESLGGQDNYGGYAWYVRTFELAEDFPKEGLLFTIGYFDEANEVYVNGTRIGSLGMRYDIAEGIGVYDGSNPWDVNCVYDIDSSILNYGGTNTIAVRMCNSTGAGGWYEGPVGLYSVAAYNKASGKPSVYAGEAETDAVLDAVQVEKAAIEAKDMDAYLATLSPDFFESGYDRTRQADMIGGWFENYDSIAITDTGAGVFVDGDLFDYQATRKVVGTKDGAETVISEGEINDYYKVEDGTAKLYGSHSRFFLDSYYSASTGKEETARIYLPEGYFDADNVKRYPTLYLFHGINSSSMTYAIDRINEVLDKAIANGEIREMIVVIPDDPTKSSFWRGQYASMVTDDLLPIVDERYRTIDDERYRFTAGCSMGGAGSFGLGLTNPNLFSGMISFYGAINYVGGTDVANALPKEYFDQYALFMACGNQDMYNFYDVQEQVSRIFTAKGIEHYHFVDNGTHSTTFYLPLFIPAVQYVQERQYQTSESGSILSGSVSAAKNGGEITVSFDVNVSAAISDYLNTIVDSEYTKNTNPELAIPVEAIIIKDGVRVADKSAFFSTAGETTISDVITLDVPAEEGEYTVDLYASAAENTVLIGSATASDVRVLFADVTDENAWYYDSVYWAVDNGVTSGMGTNEAGEPLFQPDAKLTRAQAVAFLYKLAGEPEAAAEISFTDVKDDDWFANAVKWAVANGITSGYGEGTFSPSKECNRAMIVTFLKNYAENVCGLDVSADDAESFPDVKEGIWYEASVKWAVKNGITSGMGGNFVPDRICNRAQMVTFLHNLEGYLATMR